jgi:hypothetical protein
MNVNRVSVGGLKGRLPIRRVGTIWEQLVFPTALNATERSEIDLQLLDLPLFNFLTR